MSGESVKPTCPLCTAGDARRVHHYPAGGQTLYRCWACTCRFVYPHTPVIPGVNDPLAEDPAAGFWGGPEVKEGYETWRAKENERQLGIIETLIRERSVEPNSVLEVGFGPGTMARRLARRFDSYTGIEPVPEYVDGLAADGFDRDALYASGVEDVLLDDGPLADRTGLFDAIVMVSVFEHIPRPLDVLQACRRLLTPNGVLILSTPDSSLFEIYLPIRKALRMEPWTRFHISFFTRRSLREAFDRAGLELLVVRNCPLVTPESARYFSKLQNSRWLGRAMNAARVMGLTRLLRLNNVFYGLTPR